MRSRSMLSALTPGRSNSMTKRSPSRQASIGITAGRFVVPMSCWVRRSRSRNGSVVRSNIVSSWFSRVDRDPRPTTCICGYRFLIVNPAGRIKTMQREVSTVGVYAISVAAAMVSMEIQNLRVYERRGLLTPDRTDGGTRLYSPDDVDRLERIRDLLADGLNLAGVARVLELEDEVAGLRARLGDAGPDVGLA